ncbi:hypothetical protein V2S66_03415 [Streptomyces sp. V4-01]|uniref:Uncharacterized protein n=1 Tax=Actinacidiphila polyblastidii TaxID=3110430 RepID=A0ABU7P709_9ACTN|nr:hypothetical protein [Streptomyces sp. V4-01]
MPETTPAQDEALRAAAEFLLKNAGDIYVNAQDCLDNLPNKFPDAKAEVFIQERKDFHVFSKELDAVVKGLTDAGFTPPA